MKEIISIHIGQAGVQIGEQYWRLLAAEHQVGADGAALEADDAEADCKPCMFYETRDGRLHARSLFVDMDSRSIDAAKTSSHRGLFAPNCLLGGREDSASNFGRAMYTDGRNQLSEPTCEALRKQVERCDHFGGFQLFNSMGGGSGSGLSSELLCRMSKGYPKKARVTFTLCESPKLGASIVGPYNSILHLQYLESDADLTVFYDNEAVYNTCSQQLDNDMPALSDLNAVLSASVASFSKCLRFRGGSHSDYNDLMTNLIPYPRTHFAIPSFSPFVAQASSTGSSLRSRNRPTVSSRPATRS